MTRALDPPPTDALEAEFVDAVRDIFERRIPFNVMLGLHVTSVTATSARGRIAMRDDLIGHYATGRLHGGVISACMDPIGAAAAMGAIGERFRTEPVKHRLQRFGRMGTIDLRVDYLRPALGDHFDLTATVMRLGSRVASVRMELCGPDAHILACGSAAYIVS